MAIDKSIFDAYQKSLLNNKYVDLNNSSSIIYIDDEVEVKLMTSEDYRGIDSSLIDSIKEVDKLESSSGTIEKIFNNTSQTFTSFNSSAKEVLTRYMSSSSAAFEFDDVSSLTYIEDAVMASMKEIDPSDIILGNIFETLSEVVSLIPSVTSILLTAATAVAEVAGGAIQVIGGGVTAAVSGITSVGKSLWKGITKNNWSGFGDLGSDLVSGYKKGSSAVNSVISPIRSLLDSVISVSQAEIVNYSNWLSSTLSLMSDTFSNVYIDGVSETKFGQKMEKTWKIFVRDTADKVNFNKLSNPIDNLGTEPILFGAPPRYTSISDPRDRSYMNTFIKDGNIISIIPGKPKYNGLSLGKVNSEKNKNGIINKTRDGLNFVNDFASDAYSFTRDVAGQLTGNTTGGYSSNIAGIASNTTQYQSTASQYAEVALDYLKRNGISDVFNENDKRYYTFEQDYANYYSYLETMLNTIYVRMGLGERTDGKTEMFTFFNNHGTDQETLMERFNGKSLGFYFEGNPSISENMSNDTNDPAGLKSIADSMSDEFQRINYTTGFGVKGSRKAGVAAARITKAGEAISGVLTGFSEAKPFSSLTSSMGKLGSALSGLSGFGDKMMGALSYSSSTDLNAITESMLSTNGMKTEFPNLWTDSNFSKSITVDFEFVSPYGDPLSIFQHCYVPLCSILALALPKQAEENGYVNPFFLRMDIPGVISSDFAIISNITWIRGGSNNLWTVDKHPRAISVSVTFEDLYAFLAMTKRVSYLSANPNYSMFLDSFSGIRSLYTEGNTVNNDYWNLLVNRLNANNTYADTLWNDTSVDRSINQYLSSDATPDEKFFMNYYKRDLSWMKSK